MAMLRSLIVRVVLCLVVPVAPVWGQRLSSTLDVSTQIWSGAAERREFSEDVGVALEVAGVHRARVFSRGAYLVGGAAAAHGILSEVCRVSGPASAQCFPDFPSFLSLTALAGVEGTFGVTARLLGGPAVFSAGERGTALGLQSRVDVATPPLLHLSLVASVRGAVIPNFEGRRHRFVALGLGLGIR